MVFAQLNQGAIFTDVRGHLLTWNQYCPLDKGIKRSYAVQNRDKGYGRGFHGHKKENKYIRVISGAARFIVYTPRNWDTGFWSGEIREFILDYRNPQVLEICGGNAHGWQSLEENTVILVDSNFTLEESKNDDFRFPFNILGKEVWDVKSY